MEKKKTNLILETVKVYADNEMSVYAGYATLHILMAMVPLMTLVIGLVNILPDVSLQHLETVLNDLLPDIEEVNALVHGIISNVNRQAGTLAISLSAIATLWSASTGVNALQAGLCKISGSSGSFIKRRAMALLYTLIFIALIPALLIFRVLRGSIEDLIGAVNRWLNIPDIAGRLLAFMEYSGLITAIVMAVVVLLAYTYLRGDRQKLRYQLPGTLFTTVLWLVFSRLFEIFIQRFWQASSLYGSLAAMFLAAMWLKAIVMIFFYGASLNETLMRRRSEDAQAKQ
jgi:membrane protein